MISRIDPYDVMIVRDTSGIYLPVLTKGKEQYTAIWLKTVCNQREIVAGKYDLTQSQVVAVIGDIGSPHSPENFNHLQDLIERLNAKKELNPQKELSSLFEQNS